MKTLPAAYASHIATRSTTIAHALKVTRPDGEIFGFTSHDIDDTVDGTLYRANTGIAPTSIVTAAGLGVGNMELRTLHDGTVFTLSDIEGGIWKNSDFIIFRYNYESLADGIGETLLVGTFGELELKLGELVIELRDLRQYLQHAVGSPSQKNCRYRLGDTKCGVRLNPPAWAATTAYTARTAGDAASGSVVRPSTPNDRHFKCTTAGTSDSSEPTWNTTISGTTTDGTVTWTTIQALTVIGTLTGVGDKQTFQDTGRTEAVDYFDQGTITFTSGANNGITRQVKEYAANGTFTTWLPFPNTVAIGDTYSAIAGCSLRFSEDCIAKFDNVINFGGEPHRPLIDAITQDVRVDV